MPGFYRVWRPLRACRSQQDHRQPRSHHHHNHHARGNQHYAARHTSTSAPVNPEPPSQKNDDNVPGGEAPRRHGRLRGGSDRPALYGHHVTAAELFRAALYEERGHGNASPDAVGVGARRVPDSTEDIVRELMSLHGEPSYAPVLELFVRRDLTDPDPERGEQLTLRDINWRRLPSVLATAKTPGEVAGIVAAALPTVKGQKQLLVLRKGVRLALSRLDPSMDVSATLALLNLTTLLFRGRNLPCEMELHADGLKLSAMLQLAPSLRSHLADLRHQAYKVRPEVWKEMLQTVAAQPILRGWQPAGAGLTYSATSGGWQRSDVLRLLTGWRTAGVGERRELRDVGIANFIDRDDVELVQAYVDVLARVGASTAILQYWDTNYSHIVSSGTTPEKQVLRTEGFGEELNAEKMFEVKYRAAIFVKALAAAGDPQGALHLALRHMLYRDDRGPEHTGFGEPYLALSLWDGLLDAVEFHQRPHIIARLLDRRWPELISTTQTHALVDLHRILGLPLSSA